MSRPTPMRGIEPLRLHLPPLPCIGRNGIKPRSRLRGASYKRCAQPRSALSVTRYSLRWKPFSASTQPDAFSKINGLPFIPASGSRKAPSRGFEPGFSLPGGATANLKKERGKMKKNEKVRIVLLSYYNTANMSFCQHPSKYFIDFL